MTCFNASNLSSLLGPIEGLLTPGAIKPNHPSKQGKFTANQ
ncbi:hypothetical protein AM1_6228 [Acaryochloris marina MBIC11017]|uniref:Uncharacterized protein n=1 Tax=Acaryochloris marina (strain MBIC 11017) TaxID=329726 RepID=B0C643_ACAM1|nr:hypothetical protein AM1_6228 [Acaryochloris marina MBIC11017]